MKTTNRGIISLLTCFLALTASSASAQDWPQWRGPNRDAKVTGFKPPKAWPKELAQKWKVTVGQGDATPALVGDKLYVFARQEGSEVLSCLDAATGKEIWSEKYDALGATGAASGHSGPRCSPVVASGKVVTLGVRGVLSCIDAASGKKLWRKDDFAGVWPQFFTSSSPLILDGMAVAQLGGRGNGAIVAYDLQSGEQKWKWAGDAPGYASPVVLNVGGTKLIVALTERKIVAVNAADGKPAWEAPFGVQGRGYNASSPIVDGQTIIYSGGGRGTHAVKIEKEGDGLTGKELWSNPNTAAQFNSPVLKDDLLFGLSERGEFFCINTKDGKTAWTGPAEPGGGGGPGGGGPRRPPGGPGAGYPAVPPGGGPPGGGGGFGPGGPGGGRRGGGMGGMGGGGYGSIVDAGSVLLALTPRSNLIVIEPNNKEYKEIARIKVADKQTYGYPIISGNRLFVKDQDSLMLWMIE